MIRRSKKSILLGLITVIRCIRTQNCFIDIFINSIKIHNSLLSFRGKEIVYEKGKTKFIYCTDYCAKVSNKIGTGTETKLFHHLQFISRYISSIFSCDKWHTLYKIYRICYFPFVYIEMCVHTLTAIRSESCPRTLTLWTEPN